MLPAFARAYGLPYSSREGWLSGSFERLCRQKEEDGVQRIELGVAFPSPASLGDGSWLLNEVRFYGFTENLDTPDQYDISLETRFEEILEDFKPDVVHIFGTEFPHTLAMVRAFGNPAHTLIGIQGLCCAIADSYMADLPYSVQRGASFRDRLKHDSLEQQRNKFLARAEMEAEALKGCLHITGRTRFDREITSQINPDAVYHAMNETMRSTFYRGMWTPEKAEPHRIFLSQGDYPLKGFHYMLQAMPAILDVFPDTQLYVAGNSIITEGPGIRKSWLRPLWITSYGRYLRKLIRDNYLGAHVNMLGVLNADEMKQQYLKANVFVCPSTRENSPNSLCEAMLLGTPVVAAKVGGVPDFISDGEDGILFPAGKVDELSEGVKALFYDMELSASLGAHARKSAQVTHNPDTNFMRLLEIYKSIS